jgi:transcriptional regulator with XRE-family HTH domain
MKEKHMHFGDYIRRKRLADPRELTQQNVADHLGISLSYMSAVENRRNKPFDADKLESLAEYLNLSEEDTALMYDLASKEIRGVPYDIEDTLMHEEIGDLARYALRQSKAGFIEEEDWKRFIREMEDKKAKRRGDKIND